MFRSLTLAYCNFFRGYPPNIPLFNGRKKCLCVQLEILTSKIKEIKCHKGNQAGPLSYKGNQAGPLLYKGNQAGPLLSYKGN